MILPTWGRGSMTSQPKQKGGEQDEVKVLLLPHDREAHRQEVNACGAHQKAFCQEERDRHVSDLRIQLSGLSGKMKDPDRGRGMNRSADNNSPMAL